MRNVGGFFCNPHPEGNCRIIREVQKKNLTLTYAKRVFAGGVKKIMRKYTDTAESSPPLNVSSADIKMMKPNPHIVHTLPPPPPPPCS